MLGIFSQTFLVQTAHAAVPLVEVKGEVTPEIRKLLGDVIGEAVAPARSLAQARRRAEGVIEQTGSAKLVKSWPEMVAPFETGDIYSNQKLNTLSRRVIAAGVFDSATAVLSPEHIPDADGTVTRNIILNIEQGKVNTIAAELGYSTTDGSGLDLSYEVWKPHDLTMMDLTSQPICLMALRRQLMILATLSLTPRKVSSLKQALRLR